MSGEYQVPRPPMFEDYPSDEAESADLRRQLDTDERNRQLEKQEDITGEKLQANLDKSFYLDEKPTEIPVQFWLKAHEYIAITGASGSGKHSILETVRLRMMERMQLTEGNIPPEILLTDTEIREELKTAPVKAQITAEHPGPYSRVSEMNALVTETDYFDFLVRFHKERHAIVATTWDPISTFNIMAYHYGRGIITPYIEGHQGLRQLIRESPTVTELAEEFSPAFVAASWGMMGEVVTKIRSESLTGGCPLWDAAQRPLTFICGMSLDRCDKNRRQVSTIRQYPRRFGPEDMEDALQEQIRFVQALMIKRWPTQIIEINTTENKNFAKDEADRVLAVSNQVLKAHVDKLASRNRS